MILRSDWVLPISAPPIRGGAVAITGTRIAAVGPFETLKAREDTVTDLGHCILMPGLVNPHAHLELTCYANQVKPAPFWNWIGRLMMLRAMPGQVERERQAVSDGAWQSLRAGVTCVGDISRLNLAWDVLRQIPIRKICYVELLSLAAEPPRNVAESREAFERVIEDDLLTAGMTPHAPYTVPEEQIRGVLKLAAERGRPWCMHWAETLEEMSFLRGDADALPAMLRPLIKRIGLQSPGVPALEALERCTRSVPPGLLAHMNYLDDAERLDALAAAGHTVVYCPRAHRFFGHAPHPMNRYREAGVPVAIGTDSLACGNDASLLADLRFVHAQVPEPPSPRDLLHMATLAGARALGLQDEIGSLEVGKQADLAAFPIAAEAEDPELALVSGASGPVSVWVEGETVIAPPTSSAG